jgi:hypothetical protein
MTSDKYTKFILTIIAAALSTIAAQQLFRTAEAESATCGVVKPCMVFNAYKDGNDWKPCYDTTQSCYVVGTRK